MVLTFLVLSVIAWPPGGQRYAVPATRVEPVEMHASCTPEANDDVNQGAAWLQLLAPREARRAFERAADADSDCALAYWGQASSYLPVDDETPGSAAMSAGAAALARARSVSSREPLERALVDALVPVFLQDSPSGKPARALPARLRLYRDHMCAIRDATAKSALAVFCARAAWLGSTLPGDAAAIDATRIITDGFDDKTGTLGAAVLLLQADAAPPAMLISAAGTIVRASPPAVPPWHLASRRFVLAGDWPRAAEAGEAALARAGSPVSPALLLGRRHTTTATWLLEAYLQQGRAADARRLLASIDSAITSAGDVSDATGGAEAVAVHRAAHARLWTRWLVASRGAGSAESVPAAIRRVGPSWLFDFADGLRAGLAAWPGPIPEPSADARRAMISLERAHTSAGDAEIELARVLVEATIAASQDEHPQMALLLGHAADLETRLLQTRRDGWPLVPTRELLSELWLRAYREPDAIREAHLALEMRPKSHRPWLVLARAAVRMKRPDEAASAYTQLLGIRKMADTGDLVVSEAQAFLASSHVPRENRP